MTKPLTPEQARRQADAFKGAAEFARWCIRKEKGDAASMAEKAEWNEKLAATVSAYADQAERLNAIEAAVGEVVEAWDWWLVDTYDRCRSVPNDAIERLHSLMEKTSEAPHETDS